ncbi:MAG: hypothetical protein U5R49_20945 [Deltaproteobacteria bacterium]|nr:hypothetical protein [Deltaproteobacteria bacterium]
MIKKSDSSFRKLDESSEKEIFNSYLDNNKEATSNLGELLREEMMNWENQTSAQGLESEAASTTVEGDDDIREEETDDSDTKVKSGDESDSSEAPRLIKRKPSRISLDGFPRGRNRATGHASYFVAVHFPRKTVHRDANAGWVITAR